jgi:uncharacterized Zn finger protein
MAVQCPFCGENWLPDTLLKDALPVVEGGCCECGAWWYEGMEDVDDDS